MEINERTMKRLLRDALIGLLILLVIKCIDAKWNAYNRKKRREQKNKQELQMKRERQRFPWILESSKEELLS